MPLEKTNLNISFSHTRFIYFNSSYVKFLWLPLLIIMSCTQDNKDIMLKRYLETHFNLITSPPSAVFVITEEGCRACDAGFADSVRPWIKQKKCLFLIRAEGITVNLNGFLAEAPNIRYDDGSFSSLGILEGSGMILLRNGKIDSVIPININEINAQLSYINTILDSLNSY